MSGRSPWRAHHPLGILDEVEAGEHAEQPAALGNAPAGVVQRPVQGVSKAGGERGVIGGVVDETVVRRAKGASRRWRTRTRRPACGRER